MKIKLLVKLPPPADAVNEDAQSTNVTRASAAKPAEPRSHSRFFEVDQACCIVGRVESDLLIDHPRCSRQHALLYESFDGALVVRDLESRNGTFVNGEKVTECTLCIGDEITIGKAVLTLLDFQPKNVTPAEPRAAAQHAPAPQREREDTHTGTGVLVKGSDKIFRALPKEAQGQFVSYVDEEGTQTKISLARLLKKRGGQSSK